VAPTAMLNNGNVFRPIVAIVETTVTFETTNMICVDVVNHNG